MTPLAPSQLGQDIRSDYALPLGGAPSKAFPVAELLGSGSIVDHRKGLTTFVGLRISEIEFDQILGRPPVLSLPMPRIGCHDSPTHAAQRNGPSAASNRACRDGG